MEERKRELRQLAADFESNLAEIVRAPQDELPLEDLKRKSIAIEGRILMASQEFFTCLCEDEAIASTDRSSVYKAALDDLNVNLDKFRMRRREAVQVANVAIMQIKKESGQQARERLLGTESEIEMRRMLQLKNQTKETIASDITRRLEFTRNLLDEQVEASARSVELIRESTSELGGITDIASRVDRAQRKAGRSIVRLRIAQNWDRWLLLGSIWFFGIAVAFVIYRGLTRNVIVDLGRVGFRLGKKMFGGLWRLVRGTPLSTESSDSSAMSNESTNATLLPTKSPDSSVLLAESGDAEILPSIPADSRTLLAASKDAEILPSTSADSSTVLAESKDTEILPTPFTDSCELSPKSAYAKLFATEFTDSPQLSGEPNDMKILPTEVTDGSPIAAELTASIPLDGSSEPARAHTDPDGAVDQREL
jgi:hypothetical protein